MFASFLPSFHRPARVHVLRSPLVWLSPHPFRSEISRNVASAAEGTAHVVSVLDCRRRSDANPVLRGSRARRLRSGRSRRREPATRSGRFPRQGGCLAKAALWPAQLRKRESRHGFLILTAPLGSPLARGRADTREIYAWLAAVLPSAACAAARRAIGTRKGEQDT
jgi:hypothetical protein